MEIKAQNNLRPAVKPMLDLNMYSVTFHLKPWKGKISSIVTIILCSPDELTERIDERISVLKKEGKHKRRKITHVSYLLHANL